MSEGLRQTNPSWREGWIALENVGAAMIVCDAQRRFVGASRAARNLFVRAGIALGEPFSPLPESLWAALRVAVADQGLWRPTPGRCLVGVSRYALGDTHSLLVMREVPESGRVSMDPDSQARLARRLHEQRLEATGRLVVTLAHDLRNPLASILLNVEALRAQPELDEDWQLALGDVHTAVERVRRAIDALVEFGRQGPPALAAVTLEDVFARVAGALRPALRAGRHQLVLDLGQASVSANQLLLEQILGNLVTNALESRESEVTVTVSAEREGAAVRLTVTDDGPGIHDSMLERVFEPFHTTRPGRIGLGLTVAREAAHSMGGEIVALPIPEGGGCLRLTLPAAGSGR